MKRPFIIAAAAFALAGCNATTGAAPLYTAVGQLGAVNALLHTLDSTASTVGRATGIGQQPNAYGQPPRPHGSSSWRPY